MKKVKIDKDIDKMTDDELMDYICDTYLRLCKKDKKNKRKKNKS